MHRFLSSLSGCQVVLYDWPMDRVYVYYGLPSRVSFAGLQDNHIVQAYILMYSVKKKLLEIFLPLVFMLPRYQITNIILNCVDTPFMRKHDRHVLEYYKYLGSLRCDL